MLLVKWLHLGGPGWIEDVECEERWDFSSIINTRENINSVAPENLVTLCHE